MSDDDSDDNSDDSDFLSSEEEVEDTPEAKRAARRLYRQGKPYRSKGVLSAEWLACRDAMKRGDSPGYAKLMGLLRKGKARLLSKHCRVRMSPPHSTQLCVRQEVEPS
mmetsp:Transcript_34794/g.78642  ORF Transcript_34794/g.78642 Transcript_34794/m.78642 type:complete len:108 (+) Transcript_34794:53-376(+)